MKAKLRLLKAKRYTLRCAQESQLSLTQEGENLDEKAFYWNHSFCEYKRGYVELVTGPPTQLFARAANFSDVTTDCDVTKFYETFFCSVFGIY